MWRDSLVHVVLTDSFFVVGMDLVQGANVDKATSLDGLLHWVWKVRRFKQL